MSEAASKPLETEGPDSSCTVEVNGDANPRNSTVRDVPRVVSIYPDMTPEERKRKFVVDTLGTLMAKDEVDLVEASRIGQMETNSAVSAVYAVRELLAIVAELKSSQEIDDELEQRLRPDGNGLTTYKALMLAEIMRTTLPKITKLQAEGAISPALAQKLRKANAPTAKRALEAIDYIRAEKAKRQAEGTWKPEDEAKFDYEKRDATVIETQIAVGLL